MVRCRPCSSPRTDLNHAPAGALVSPLRAPLALAVGLLAGCGTSSGPNGSITLYNGQHEQTTDALVTAFEKQTGINVNVRNDDEDVFAAQIAAEGSNSPADVFYTENTPALENLREKGLLAPVLPSTLAATPAKFNSAHRRLGRDVGAGQRDGLQHERCSSRASCRRRSWRWPIRSGRASSRSRPQETDFQPIVTSVAAAPRQGRGAARGSRA